MSLRFSSANELTTTSTAWRGRYIAIYCRYARIVEARSKTREKRCGHSPAIRRIMESGMDEGRLDTWCFTVAIPYKLKYADKSLMSLLK